MIVLTDRPTNTALASSGPRWWWWYLLDHRPIEKLSAHLAPLFTFPPPSAAHTSLSPGTKMFVIQQKVCYVGLGWVGVSVAGFMTIKM